jgi:hypothetical protein
MKTMRRILILIVSSIISLNQTFGAIEIIDHNIQPPGEYEKRPVPFIDCKSGVQIMLPLSTLTLGKVFNEDKTILAINVHELSDFDTVDLLVEKGDKIFLIDNIWTYVGGNLVEANILSTQTWDRMFLEVKSIQKNKLTCQFRGSNSPNIYVEKTFSIFIDINDDVMKMEVK